MAKGDHLYIHGHLFDHHGIDCGDGTVIHYSGSIKGGTNRITRVFKREFAKGKQIRIKSYETKYSGNEIVNRAVRRLNKSHTEGYNVVFNNCEHFAYDCTTGDKDSWQLFNAGTGVVGAGVVGGFMATATATVTTEVAAGGFLGWLGATTITTTTVAAFPVAVVAGATALTVVALYSGLKWLDNLD